MSELTTKEFNEIYKRNFREYFDKPLKKDGFYKKGTINFYRMNSLGMVETLNFQRHYENLTINYSIKPIYCSSTKDSATIGKRLGEFVNVRESHWWDVSNDEMMKKNMEEMLEIIQTKLYAWFKEMEDEKAITEKISKSYQAIIDRYITQAATAAKFKRYHEILPYIEKVKEEYVKSGEERERPKWYDEILEEALLIEEKVKEGKESVDEYIKEREKQSLIEMGLEKLIK